MGRPGRADRTVVVQRMIDAPPSVIFQILADPQRHHELDGSGMLLGEARGPERLTLGATFSMAMQQSKATYRSLNRVTDCAEGRVIEWETVGERNGRRLIGGQRWRFELVPIADPLGPTTPDSSRNSTTEKELALPTLVVHSYDWGAATAAPVIRLAGYPRRMARSMPETLQRLASAATSH